MACFLLRSDQDWMDDTGNCTSWNAQFMSYYTDLNVTILQNHVLHFLAHFLWRCFHWLTWTWIVFNGFPTPPTMLWTKTSLGSKKVKYHNIQQSSFHGFLSASPLPLWGILSWNTAHVSLYTCMPLHLPSSNCQHLRQTHLWIWLLHVKTCMCKVMPGVAI